jgi:hypothetical protein
VWPRRLWYVHVFPAQAWHKGEADTLEEAKVAFKAALDEVPAERRIPPGFSAGHDDWKRAQVNNGKSE